jgi:hypothetical protein
VKFALRFPFVADPEQQANNVALIQAVNTLGELEFIGTGSPNNGDCFARRLGIGTGRVALGRRCM